MATHRCSCGTDIDTSRGGRKTCSCGARVHIVRNGDIGAQVTFLRGRSTKTNQIVTDGSLRRRPR